MARAKFLRIILSSSQANVCTPLIKLQNVAHDNVPSSRRAFDPRLPFSKKSTLTGSSPHMHAVVAGKLARTALDVPQKLKMDGEEHDPNPRRFAKPDAKSANLDIFKSLG